MDIDLEKNIVNVTPEKGSKPLILKISGKLAAMLRALEQRGEHISRNGDLEHFAQNFRKQRRRIATKLKNPNINRITFKTLRHYKGTIKYHRTKDILHVMEVLGHKNIKSTLVYTHPVNFESEDFISKVGKNAEDACKLVEAGFEYVCTTPESLLVFKKRK